MNPKAKRIIRSVKYFFIFVILAAVFTGVIVLISPEQYGDINRIFATSPDSVPGEALFSYGSWWKMLLIFVIIAAIYPGLTFVKKEVMIEGDFEDHRDKIINEFEQAGYEKVSEDPEKLTFRIKNGFTRFMRAYEDAVTITKGEAPLILEGNRKDILRLESRISYALRNDSDAPLRDDPYDFGGPDGTAGDNSNEK